MERQTRQVSNKTNRNPSVHAEHGFTYLELTISLFIILVMLPAIFFCLLNLVTDGQKLMGGQRLQMEWLTCYTWMQKEIKQGSHFRTVNEALLFEMPNGDTVRYQWQRHNLVRAVRKPNSAQFLGHTLLLPHIVSFRFLPMPSGVMMGFTLMDDSQERFSVRAFLSGRTQP